MNLLLINYAGQVLFKQQEVKLPPLNMQIDITTTCNLQCKMCPRGWMDAAAFNKNMTLEQFKSVCETVKPKSINLAASGEPTLNREFIDMVRFAKNRDIKVVTSSNFIRIANSEDYMEDVIDSGIDVIKVSIDAADKNTYLKIRGKSCFDEIVRGIELFEQKKKIKGLYKPSLRFDFVLQKDNYSEIDSIMGLANRLKIKHVFFRKLQTDGFDKNKIEDISGNYEDISKTIDYVLNQHNYNGVKTNLRTIKKLYEKESVSKNSNIRSICLAPWIQVFVSPEGNLSPCCSLGLRGINIGNVFEDEFDSIWNGKKMMRLRDMFRMKKNYDAFEVCHKCVEMSFKNLWHNTLLMPGYLVEFLKDKL